MPKNLYCIEQEDQDVDMEFAQNLRNNYNEMNNIAGNDNDEDVMVVENFDESDDDDLNPIFGDMPIESDDESELNGTIFNNIYSLLFSCIIFIFYFV